MTTITRLKRALLSYGLTVVLALGSTLMALPIQSAQAAAGDLTINEINWAGSFGLASDEWVELYNPATGSVIDFTATPHTLELYDAADTLLDTITIGAGAPTLNPGEYLVIHNAVAGTTLDTSAPGVFFYEPASPFTLPNLATQYILKDDTATELDALKRTTPADPIPFEGQFGTSEEPTASMSREYAAGMPLPGDSLAAWRTSMTIGAHFTPTTVQYGTPGAENIEVTVPTNVMISPEGSSLLPADPVVSGDVTAGVTEVTLFIDQQGPTPSSTTQTLVPAAGSFSEAVTLTAGRYLLSVAALDAEGNQSPRTVVPAYAGDTEGQYVVITDSSSLPAPVLDPVPALTNQTAMAVTGTVDPLVVEVDVLLNGMYQQTVSATDVFAAVVFLAPNSINALQFIAVAADGTVSEMTEVMVEHDDIAPLAVDVDKVVVSANTPGTQDMITGQPGAAEGTTDLYVYADAALTKLIAGPEAVAVDGSFAAVGIGDNAYGKVYLVVRDAAGNASAAVEVVNPISFVAVNGIAPRLVEATETSARFEWNQVPGAVNYRIKYRLADGTFTSPITVCGMNGSDCVPAVTLSGLNAATHYVLAVAAVDAYGNQTPYVELSFATLTPPIEIEEVSAPIKVTRTQPSPVAREIEESGEQLEEGEVKSTVDEVAENNWTPWIVLAILLAVAILASLGYFYWFGGAAGAEALASAEASKERMQEKAAAASRSRSDVSRGKAPPKPPTKPPKGTRW